MSATPPAVVVPEREELRARLLDRLARLEETGSRIPCRSGHPAARAAWTADDDDVQRVAAKLCAGCPAWKPCRDYSRRWPREAGVFGGRTERDRMHRTKETTPCPT